MDAKSFYIRHKILQEKEWTRYYRQSPSEQGNLYSVNKIVLRMLKQLPNIESILDIGCGALGLLKLLKGKITNLYGIDIVDYTVWSEEPDIITKVADVDKEGLPFPDNSFDCVTMLMVLEHLYDPFGTMKEVYRVVKPEGYFVLSVPNIAGIKHRISLLLGRLPITSSEQAWGEKEWDGGHLHYFTLGRLKWLLKEQGPFKISDIKGSGRFQFLKSIKPSFFSQDLIILSKKA